MLIELSCSMFEVKYSCKAELMMVPDIRQMLDLTLTDTSDTTPCLYLDHDPLLATLCSLSKQWSCIAHCPSSV